VTEPVERSNGVAIAISTTTASADAPTRIEMVSALSAGMPTALKANTELISRMPHPAKLMGRLAANITTHAAAASGSNGTSGARACAATR